MFIREKVTNGPCGLGSYSIFPCGFKMSNYGLVVWKISLFFIQTPNHRTFFQKRDKIVFSGLKHIDHPFFYVDPKKLTVMEENGLTSHLLCSPTSDHSTWLSQSATTTNTWNQKCPFWILQSSACLNELATPVWSAVDPLKNHNLKIEGVYKWFSIAICFPIALARHCWCTCLGFLY